MKRWEYITEKDKLNHRLISNKEVEYVYTEPYFINNHSLHPKGKLKRCNAAPVHETLVLKEVTIIGSSDLLILESGRIYYPFKEYDKNNRFKHTGNGIILSNDQKCIQKKGDVYPEIIERGLKFVHKYTWNYYHFMIELATLFQEVENSSIPLPVPILIDDICLKVPQFVEVVNILNKQKRELIPIKPFTQYRINHLILPQSVNIIPPGWNDFEKIEAQDVLYKAEGLQYLRENMMPYKSNKTYPKKIFLSRKNASKRRKYNEKKVEELLHNHGFSTIYIEEFTVSEQISLFNGAECIISTTGAALTNLIYCKTGCKVLIFTNVNDPISYFSTLGTWAGAEVNYIYDKARKYTYANSIHYSFKVDLSVLSQYLVEINTKPV